MQSQSGGGSSLEARHDGEQAQGAARRHMLYQSNDCYSGDTAGPPRAEARDGPARDVALSRPP